MTVLALVLLVLHLLCCAALWLVSRTGTLNVRGSFLPFMVLIPVWGPLCVVLLYARNALTDSAVTPPDLEKLRINEELHRSILVEGRETTGMTVPLEEALIVNSAEQRRKLILSVLNDDPLPYYDLLQQARMNEDSEVVHYAATAMAQISKQADLTLQQQEARYAANPQDKNVLAEYCDYLQQYLDSGLVQGRAAEIQRRQLVQLLQKRLADAPNYRLGCRVAAVQLDLQEYDAAGQTLAELTRQRPQQEAAWLLRLRSAAACHDGNQLQEILHSMAENHVYLSAQGRETVRFWQPDLPEEGGSRREETV